ncbi:MAG: DNA polymerase III subunit gamma/tau [Sphingomicrobium sp.]
MTDDESPGLGLDLPEAAAPAAPASPATPYRVLARKYRPQTFHQLIGQDAMVQTLGNAIERGRIAHAFLLTGVRGVGKTSTARLVAKALNCVGPDGQGGPTIEPCGVCEHCVAITEGRHIDVIEMDAASHTGVDDVREIIEAVRYASVSARYKIYIVDEVHMLSKNAFNALLKTLEEPPEHVKFLFATTEVAKLPVTVLSRCQRFDLRRIPADKLVDHFAAIAQLEQVEAETEALAMIARAAEGSARDGLSILDQAIALGSGTVTADQVRDMLGLADRGRIRGLLQLVLAGDTPAALAELDQFYALGTDAGALLRGLMEELHAATRAKAGPASAALQSAEQRQSAEELAGKLSWADIHRLWQMLLKGLSDVQVAPDPHEAATMALLRLIHAADLPDPAQVLSRLAGEGASNGTPPARSATPGAKPAASADTAPSGAAPADFRALVALLDETGKRVLAQQLHDQVGLIRYAPPELALKPLKPLGADWTRELDAALKAITGSRWQIAIADEPAEPSLLEQEKMAEERVRADVLADSNVRAVLEAFPVASLETFAQDQAFEPTKGA